MRGGHEAILLQGCFACAKKPPGVVDELLMIVQRLNGKRVKLASYGINVRERKLTRMRAIGQQDKHALPFSVDPAARAGETGMTERVGRETSAGG